MKGIKAVECQLGLAEKTASFSTHNSQYFAMFPRLAVVIAASFAVLAAATPVEVRGDSGDSQCNGGTISCCNSVQDASSSSVTSLLGLLGLSLGSITGQVGLNCSPLTVVGVGSGASCTSQTVCCTGNSFNGLINVGCTPINVAL